MTVISELDRRPDWKDRLPVRKPKTGDTLAMAQMIADCEAEDWGIQTVAHGWVQEQKCNMHPADFEALFVAGTAAMVRFNITPRKGIVYPSK